MVLGQKEFDFTKEFIHGISGRGVELKQKGLHVMNVIQNAYYVVFTDLFCPLALSPFVLPCLMCLLYHHDSVNQKAMRGCK